MEDETEKAKFQSWITAVTIGNKYASSREINTVGFDNAGIFSMLEIHRRKSPP